MASTTFRRDFLGRQLITPSGTGTDYMGRLILASDKDYMGRALVAKQWAISTAFTLGQTMQGANSSTIEYACTVAGTTLGSGSGPVAPGYGLTVTDGTATWQQITTS